MSNKAKRPPMTDANSAAIISRLDALGQDDAKSALWMTIGGMEYLAAHRPTTRVREFFDILEEHVAKFEAKRATA